MASASADDPAAALYQPNRVDVIALTLDPTEKANLEAEPEEYVKGTFALAETDGTPAGVGSFTTPRPVEIRLKGDASFHNLDGKAAFKLKFKSADAFMGLRKMTLNNMVEDPSMIHETLAYAAFRATAVPSPRTSFAYVRLNGDDYGMHLDLETLDKVALEKRFGPFAAPQHLYEGEAGDDVRPGGATGFEVDEGDEKSLTDLEALIAAANSTGPGSWATRVAPNADLSEMTKMWAVEKYVGELDGYTSGADPFQPNNYYLYGDSAGRFQMLPWGADETWKQSNHLDYGEGHGILFANCLGDADCRGAYRAALSGACGAIEGAGLDALALATANRLAPWQALEQGNGARHEYDPAEIAEGVDDTRAFIAARPAETAAFLGEPCASTPVPPVDPGDPGNPTDPANPGGGSSAGGGATSSAGSTPDGNQPEFGATASSGRFALGRAAVVDRLLSSELTLPSAGEIRQRVTIATADGELVVGRADAAVKRARDLTLDCRLSAALGERLRLRRLTLRIATRFVPAAGTAKTITRRLTLPRAP